MPESQKSRGKAKAKPINDPERIEELRRLRAEKKARKNNEANEQPKLKFITRPMLTIPGQAAGNGLEITIMSYNVLAQALIRRKLFPTSGAALKWGTRSQVLLSEFNYYDSDIICLQEVDYIQYNSFWKGEFQSRGYSSQFHREDSKNHGVAICYKRSKFVFQHSMFIDYDKIKTGDIEPITITRNVGLMVYLQFTDDVLIQHPNLSRSGIIIGTTHLFWHPYGTAERTRQTLVVLQQMKEFTRNLNLLYGSHVKFYRFFAGDFNSQPFDSPYLSITAKPITYSGRAKNVLGRSLMHEWSPTEKEEGEDQDDEKKDNEEEDKKSNVEDTPVPETFQFSPEVLDRIQAIERLHNNLDMRAVSLYSVGYHLVHPQNAGRDNNRNEPMFSNWAHAWRGLLDYIFVVADWDMRLSYVEHADTVEQLLEQHVRLLALLRMPEPEEMGSEPSGQPRTGQYPSDHLCLIARIELC